MFPTNPAITDGVSLFVWIVVIFIGFVTVITVLDIRKVKNEEKEK